MSAPATNALVDLRFDSIEPGMTFGPFELKVTEQLIKAFAFATDDYTPLCRDWSVAHAAILAPDLLRLFNTRFDPNTVIGLHQKEELWVQSPVRVGETVRMEGQCVDKYTKRGKGYYVVDATARSVEDGRLLMRHRSTEIAEIDPALPSMTGSTQQPERRVKGEVDRDREPVAVADVSLEVGTPVVPLHKTVNQDQISVFSNGGQFWRNVHTDLEQAQRAGYERTLAQGLMQSMYVSQLGTAFFGESWFTSGWLSTIYLKPVLEGDSLSVQAVVLGTRSEAAQTLLELEVWIENSDGVRTSVGWLGADVWN